jgi:IclR family mhp operon transcriptional activator
MEATEKGVPIRAVSRALAVLQAINRGGSLSMMQICREAQVPYPTACRLIQTLIHEGMVEREPARKRYRATALVQSLSLGFQDDDRLVAVARPHIVRLTQELAWPVSVVSRVGNLMMLRDSTHKLTSLTFTNYAPGYTLPLTECSSGKVYLAYCPEAERDSILKGLGELDSAPDRIAKLLLQTRAMFDQIRTQGYAVQQRNAYTATPGKTSSIAVPVFRDEQVQGALALIYFASAMPLEDAEKRFVGPLKATAAAVSAELSRAPARAA